MKFSIYEIIRFTVSPLLFFVVLGVGLPMIESKPQSYISSARIWIQAQYPKSGAEDSASNNGLYLPLISFFNSPIKTAGELLRSDMVLRFARKEALKTLPEAACPSLGEMRDVVKTEEVKDTDVLRVSYSSRDPNTACVVLQGIVNGFLQLNSDQASASAIRSREFLEDQITSLKIKLAKTREDIKHFRSAKDGATDLERHVSSRLDRVTEIETQIQDAKIEIAKGQELISYFKSRKQDGRPEALASLMREDPVCVALEEKIADAEVQLAGLSNRLLDTHPYVQSLHARIQNYRKVIGERLKDLRANALADVASGPATDASSPERVMRTKVASANTGPTTLEQAEADVIEAQGQLAALNRQLGSSRSELTNIPAQQLRYAELTRSEEFQEKNLTVLENRLNEAQMVETVVSGVTNIQVIDPPVVPPGPTGPSKELLWAASAMVSLVLSAGTFFLLYTLDPTAKKIGDIPALLNFPVLGAFQGTPTDGNSSNTRLAFDRLRLALLPVLGNHEKIICIMSPSRHDGKTGLSIGLAKTLADSGRKVCLIEVNEHNPMLAAYYKLRPPVTLQQYLDNPTEDAAEKLLHQVSANLWVCVSEADRSLESAFELDSGKSLITALCSGFDYVVVDTAATTESSVAFSLIPQGAVPIIVVRMKHTRVDSANFLAEQLRLQNVERGALVLAGTNQQAVQKANIKLETPAATAAVSPASTHEGPHLHAVAVGAKAESKQEENDDLWS